MLRINLLPDYIGSKNKTKVLWAGWGIGILAAAALMLVWYSSVNAANADAVLKRTAAEDLQHKTEANKSAIQQEDAARAQVQAKQTFVQNSQKFNDGWPDVFETIRDVKPSDNSIILNSMSVDNDKHQVVSLAGWGSNEIAIVRWWMTLRNNTDLFDHVNFDLTAHSFSPQAPASANGGGGPGAMGMPGGMSGGGMSAMMPQKGKMLGLMGSGGPGSGGMMGGMGRAGGGATASAGPAELEGKPGMNFTASVVLKAPMAGGVPTPSWPGGAGGDSGAGGGGPMMRGPGGMGGPATGGGPPMGGGAKGGAAS